MPSGCRRSVSAAAFLALPRAGPALPGLRDARRARGASHRPWRGLPLPDAPPGQAVRLGQLAEETPDGPGEAAAGRPSWAWRGLGAARTGPGESLGLGPGLGLAGGAERSEANAGRRRGEASRALGDGC